MEQYGVHLSPEENTRMMQLEEGDMINQLVTRMPQQTKEQFEHFFLQLQLIVSTATRVRTSLEEGTPSLIEEALNDADETGITPYILKMALVQAGSEVRNLQRTHDRWATETEVRMSTLLRGAEDAMQAQRQLAAAQAQLGQFTGSHKDKGKKMMMGVAAKNDKACMDLTLTEWYKLIQKQKKENEIRKEYEERIVKANQALFEYKQNQKGNAKGVLMKQAAKGDGAIVAEVYFLLKKEVEDKKLQAEAEKKLAEIEAKMAAQSAKNKENTKSVLMRNLAASDNMLCDTCLEAWKSWLVEYKKNKEQEDAVKLAEQKVEAFMNSKSDGAKSVIEKMNAATDSGLVEHVISTWCQLYKEQKEAEAFQAKLDGDAAKFGAFNSRNKGGAMTAGQKADAAQKYGLVLHAFILWQTETKQERILRYYQGRIDGRKSQLSNLQNMFQTFATQLEKGIKEGTPRAMEAVNQKQKKMSRGDSNTGSLPNIHQKQPGSGSHRSGRASQGGGK